MLVENLKKSPVTHTQKISSHNFLRPYFVNIEHFLPQIEHRENTTMDKTDIHIFHLYSGILVKELSLILSWRSEV